MATQRNGAVQPAPLTIEYRSIHSLRVFERNARHHPEKQLRRLERAIGQFGFNCPISIDEDDVILAGHARVEAAKRLGLSEIPTIRLPNMTPSERRAFVLADNRIAELATWDREMLALELQELADLGEFELELTGFTIADIDVRLEEARERKASSTRAEDILPKVESAAVTKHHDVWLLGPHRLLCGDATSAPDYQRLMCGTTARVQFSDPPYNRPTRTFSGRGRVRHRDFVQGCGEMTESEYSDFLLQFLEQSSKVMVDGGITYSCIDWQHLFELLSAARRSPLKLENLVVWSKTPGMGGLYRSAHELIAVFKNGDAPCLNNVALGAHGRNRSNIWHHPSAPNFSSSRRKDLAAHPTPKPVELVADALRDVSGPGSIVLDPFLGSGTTVIAAEKTGRIAHGMELDPLYCDVVVRRWQRYAGKSATLEGCNKPFDIIEAERMARSDADHCERPAEVRQ